MSKKFTKLLSMALCVIMAVSLCACGGQSANTTTMTDDESKHVTIKWMVRNSQPNGFEEVIAAANEYLNEKLNITLDLQCIEPGDYDSKVQLALAAGENVDIIWTSDWANDYLGNSNKGAYLALDEYLELPELQGLKNYYDEFVWNAARINGKIYGVPVEQMFHTQQGYWFHKSVAEKYDLINDIRALAWVDDNNHGTMNELEEVFDVVRAGEPEEFHIATGGFDTFVNQHVQAAGYDIIDGKVTPKTEEEELALAARYRRWNEKGYFPADVATNDNLNALTDAGKVFTRYNRHFAGSEERINANNPSFAKIAIPTSDMVIMRSGIQSTINALSMNCQNPVRALKLMYLMHTDEYIMNLLSYGIEGTHYTLDENGRMLRAAGGYYLPEFLIGSNFICNLIPSYADDVWEQIKNENATAKIDEHIGFAFDPSNVESEISQCSAVNAEYRKILNCGLEQDYESVYAEKEKKLQLAGKQVVIDEIQRQLDEWSAAQ